MTNRTLYLVQASYSAAPQAFAKLKSLYAAHDTIVLMGESVMHVNHAALKGLSNISILESDSALLTPNSSVNILTYDDFAQLCLSFNRCISLK